MRTIKAILDTLPPAKREQLMTAFELGFAQIVKIEHNLHIGVNTDTIRNFHPSQKAGSWAVGTLSTPIKDKL